MPDDGITSSRGKVPYLGLGDASCEGCDFRMECTRLRARLHVVQRGHVVHFVIRDITTYYPPEKTDA